MKKIKESIGEIIFAYFVIGILIVLAGLLFYAICCHYGGNTRYAWIPTILFGVSVISIIIYDQRHPDGGML